MFRLIQILMTLAGSVPDERPRPAPTPVGPRLAPPPAAAAPMRLLQTEYLLKGIFLGFVLYAALLLAALPPAVIWQDGLLRFSACTFAGLAAALLVASVLKLRDGVRVNGRFVAFVLFLLLESPFLTYVGLLAGAGTGVLWLREMLGPLAAAQQEAVRGLLTPVVGGSAVAGLVFGLLRQVQHPMARTGLILALAGGLLVVGMASLGLTTVSGLNLEKYTLANPTAFACLVLVGIPAFYLLTFAGHEEESEVEIAAMCGLLGLALAILVGDDRRYASLPYLVPVALFFLYTIRVLPGLRILKHAFRGLGYARGGKHRKALLAFRRALQLDPANRIARDGFWEVHRTLDLDTLARDPQTLGLVDLDLCLDRAGGLLLHRPDAAQLDEANRLLDLVVRLQPDKGPQVDYWHAVAATHGGDLDRAGRLLERLLDPSHHGPDSAARHAVLLPAWQLALTLHPRLRERVGEPLLTMPGRRMEAIAAVERRLAEVRDDPDAIALKKLLYRDLNEADYDDAAGGSDLAASGFDHDYSQHLGLSMINDDARWQRGGEYLRIAARGLPALGPTLFVQIAQAQRRMGLMAEARHNFELAKRAGLSVGPRNLGDAERQAYFATLKHLGEEALGLGDTDAAIDNFRLYQESEQSGLATLRVLADLYEKKGDALAAARATDQALQYNGTDPELLERKARYYYSIDAADFAARVEQYGPGFDFDYCLREGRTVLDKHTDLDWLDVARHLTGLALVARPDSLTAKVLHARVRLRLGERDEAIRLLEEARGPAVPERFASYEDQEAWYVASQLLGDLYLETGEAAKAATCLNDFRKSAKSGAKTWFKLAQAYEAMGDIARARKCYGQAAAYDGNPVAGPALEALSRLEG
ncbi:MAG: tetratricopeptide repeat protein [Gemmataceae bacterium]